CNGPTAVPDSLSILVFAQHCDESTFFYGYGNRVGTELAFAASGAMAKVASGRPVSYQEIAQTVCARRGFSTLVDDAAGKWRKSSLRAAHSSVGDLPGRLLDLVRETPFGDVVLRHLGSNMSHTQAQELQVHAVLDTRQAVAMTQAVERDASR